YMAKILLLIVEDEMTLAQMYETKFRAEGFDIEIAHDGREGIDKMRRDHPSIVLMDIIMPNFDGLEALRQAKADSKTSAIPIIVLTNISDEKYAKEAIKEGAAAYVIKSENTPAQMVELVKNTLK
ncbi:MAG TPA: response regulator, partial [Candidatus Saccharimonadales bacterium]|nr:response regulator [Candidatus Saccharimonadales bacterium]